MPDDQQQARVAEASGFGPLLLPFCAAVGAGVLLRVWRLQSQLFGGDEIHGLFVALTGSLWDVLTTYVASDPCLPLSGYYRLLLLAGVEPGEVLLRLPSVVAGIVTLVVVPLWIKARLGPRVAVLTAVLLAISPLHVFLSRMARPYSIAILLSFLALLAFERFWHSGSRRAGLAYAISSALTGYFHLGFTPFVASVFVYALLTLRGRPGGPGLKELAGLGLVTSVGYLLFLVPAHESLGAVIELGRGGEGVASYTLRALFFYEAGTRSVLFAGLFWLCLVWGAVGLWRCSMRLALFLFVPVTCQVFGVFLIAPEGLDLPHVFARYLVATLPFALTLVALGLDGLVERGGSRLGAGARVGLQVAALAAAVLTGPFVERAWWTGNFSQSVSQAYFWRDAPAVEAPAIYAELTGSGPIVEAPWSFVFRFSYFMEAYQQQHGRQVWVVPGGGSPSRALVDPKVDLATAVEPTVDALTNSGAEWLVLHGDPHAEALAVRSKLPWAGMRNAASRAGQERVLERYLSDDARRMGSLRRQLIDTLGAPDRSRGGIEAWDLRRPG